MKHALLVLVVVVVLVSTCFSMPETGRTEVGGNFWFRYHLDRTDESTQRSSFNVERGYIGLGYGWTPEVSGLMTVNVFSSPSSGGATGWNFELRDAYLNLGYFIPHGKIRVGLQKNYFGTVHDWKYLTVRRSLANAVGVVEERDYGIAFLGNIPNGMGEWSLGIMNGEGFSSGLAPWYADRQPGVMATLRLVPMRETVVGVSVLRDKRYVFEWDEMSFERDENIGYADRTALSFMARVGSGPFSLLGEYLYYDYPIPDRESPDECAVNVKGTGFSVFPMVRLTEKFDIVGRYDAWDPDKDSENSIWEAAGTELFSDGEWHPEPWWIPSDYDARYYYVKHSVYAVGFNYNITERMEGEPGVTVQVNWQRMDPEEEITNMGPLDAMDSLIFQIRWGWGGLDF